MILTICALITLTVALAAFVLAPRLAPGRVLFDQRPDRPVPFGYRMAWLAIRTRNTARVVDVLGLSPIDDANWRTGIGTVYDETLGASHIYVTPPVNGWTFVVGLTLPQPLGGSFADKCTPVLLDLASAFPEAQYFLCYPPMDMFAWARAADGKLVRAFAIGDDGIIWNKGRMTKDERAMGLKHQEMRGVRGRSGDVGRQMIFHPTEAHLMHLASCWSLDPTSITAAKADAAVGAVCAAPAKWRPERLRRAG